MPDLSPSTRKDVKIESLIRDPEAHFPTTSAEPEASKHVDRRESNTKAQDDSTGEDQGSAENETPSPAVFTDSSGNEHYIGPSGTLNFLHQLRQVFMSAQGPPSAFGPHAASQIPNLNTTQTLEPEDQSLNSATNHPNSKSSLTDWQEALSLLPRADVLDPLVNAYFQHTHEDFPLFQRHVFEDQFNFFFYSAGKSMRAPQRTAYPTPDWGWLGCLYMILVFGSITRPELGPIDHALLQKQSVAASRVLLPQLIAKCSLNNLRALILLALYMHNSNERNASWNLVGTAIRMAFAIGLHRKVQDTPSIEAESRNMVLSTLYSFELFLAANLGRPSSLSETDVEVFPLPPALGRDGSGTDPELISLTVGLNSILQRTRLMYARRKPTYGGNSDMTLKGGVDDIQDRLQRWREDLTRHPQFDIPTIQLEGRTGSLMGIDGPKIEYQELQDSFRARSSVSLRALLMLHVQFHYIGIITTRHFLLHDIAAARLNTTGKTDNISTLAQSCVLHSHQLSYIFLLMDDFQIVNGRTGFDVFYGYWAGMLLNLMLLWPKSTKHLPEPGQPCPLRSLVNRVHGVVTRVDKSGTMQRLSTVMDAFVAWAGRVGEGQDHDTSPGTQQNGFTTLNGAAPSFPQHHFSQSGPSPGITTTMLDTPVQPTGLNQWASTQTPNGNPFQGTNMGLMNLPSGNGATAFLNSFLAPDDQAAILGMINGDIDTQGYKGA